MITVDDKEKIKKLLINNYIADVESKVDRFLKVDVQKLIPSHCFSETLSECIKIYYEGFFIATVMMSHSINEGIIKFIAEKNNIDIESIKKEEKKKWIEFCLKKFKKENIMTDTCYNASEAILKSFRNDIHHMDPKISQISFIELAEKNIKHLMTIEKEIFGFEFTEQGINPNQRKYWSINQDGTGNIFLKGI